MLSRTVPEGRKAAAAVAGHLNSLGQVRRVPTRELELFITSGFLERAACDELIGLIDRDRRPSTIADDVGIERFRTSETCELRQSDPPVAAVDVAICELLGIPAIFGEPIQGQRYAVGQEFRAHTDTFNPGSPDYYLHCAERGQRTWTAMLYLNDVPAGGATRFKVIGKTIQPQQGTLLTWNNLRPDGFPNDATLHHGMKVRSGTKYVLTKWFRELPWTSANVGRSSR